MKIITVRIKRVYVREGKVTEITVTEDGRTDLDLYVEPCAQLPYYREGEFKDLAVSGSRVYAASQHGYFGEPPEYYDPIHPNRTVLENELEAIGVIIRGAD